jgi:hypothetical protein
VVAPPSASPKGIYRYVQGELDDLARLSVMRAAGVDQTAARVIGPKRQPSPLRGMREHDGRNDAMFRAIGPEARRIHQASGSRDDLLAIARRINAECAEKMEDGEVQKIVGNVWGMTLQRRNYIGLSTMFCLFEQDLTLEPDELKLLGFLRLHQGAGAKFWVTNSLAERFG